MIETITEDEGWRDASADMSALAAACYEETIRAVGAPADEVALLLTNNAAMQDLNKRFRGKDKPTNVLSFPGDDGADRLGDIAIGREICQDEARELGIAFKDRAAHLIVHGLLHLMGYDHQSDIDADDMEQREIKILTRLGVANPYAATDMLSDEEAGAT